MDSSVRQMKGNTPPCKVFQYKKVDYDQMRDDLRDYQKDFSKETKESSANDTWTKFEEKLRELMNKYIKSKMISGNKIKKAADGLNSKSPAKKGEEAICQTETNRQTQTLEGILTDQVPGTETERQVY